MTTYAPETYGDRIAAIYDDLYPEVDLALLDTLAHFAGAGPALELGIGTGRVALPLQARGVEVHGVDASEAMVARLRAKPGGERLPVTLGSFETVPVPGPYSLVYVAFNTFFALLTQEAQVECFRNVARVLAPGGVFALEVFVPDVTRFTLGQNTLTNRVTTDRVEMTVTRHDPVAQVSTSQHVFISETGIQLYPVQVRYAWPAELDLMARLAGLERKHRWSDWSQREFTAESGKHVSVYGRANP